MWQEMIGTVAVFFCLTSGCQDDQRAASQPKSNSISIKSDMEKQEKSPEFEQHVKAAKQGDTDSKNKAIEAIKALGGKIDLDDTGNVIRVDISRCNISDAGLVHLKELTNLTKLSLYDTKVTKEGVLKLKAAIPDCEIIQ